MPPVLGLYPYITSHVPPLRFKYPQSHRVYVYRKLDSRKNKYYTPALHFGSWAGTATVCVVLLNLWMKPAVWEVVTYQHCTPVCEDCREGLCGEIHHRCWRLRISFPLFVLMLAHTYRFESCITGSCQGPAKQRCCQTVDIIRELRECTSPHKNNHAG